MRPRVKCPTCAGTKDYRARQCRECGSRDHPPRRGTGRGKHRVCANYVGVMRNGKGVLEHRAVMEEMLGRPLRSDEHVHHKNHDPQDNRPENLELLEKREHHRRHMPRDRAKAMSALGHKARWGYASGI